MRGATVINDPMMTLMKSAAAETSSNNGKLVSSNSPENVLIEGSILVSRTAFIGHSFAPDDSAVVGFVKDLLTEMQIRCSSGERAEAVEVHEKVKKRILAANLFVGIFTRRDKIEGKDLWRTTDWLVEEMSFAAANGKKLILLRENGIADFGGLQGNLEYIEFNRLELHKAAPKILQTIWSLNPGKFTFNSGQQFRMSLDVLSVGVDSNPNEPLLRVTYATQLRKHGRIAGALEQAEIVLADFPAYAPALLEKAQCLREYGKRQEAQAILEQLLVVKPYDSNVRHEYAHVLAEQSNPQAESEFESAAECEPTSARHSKCLADYLARTGKRNSRKLIKAKKHYEIVRDISAGASKENAIASIKAIDRRLKELKQEATKGQNRRKGPRNIR